MYPPFVCGVPKQAESAAELRFRTENGKSVGSYRKSLNSREKREKGSWLGSKDSNLDCMIQSHESCRWTTSQQESLS